MCRWHWLDVVACVPARWGKLMQGTGRAWWGIFDFTLSVEKDIFGFDAIRYDHDIPDIHKNIIVVQQGQIPRHRQLASPDTPQTPAPQP